MRLALIFVLACGGQNAAEPAAEAPTGEQSLRPVQEEATAAPLELDPSAPPVVRFWAEAQDSGATLHLQNRGGEAIQLRSALVMEVKSDETWEAVDVQLALRSDCEAEPPACVTLAPGGELIPPNWLGTRGDAQCTCERCVAVQGEVRFVAQSCAPEGTTPHEIRSEALVVAP